MTFNSRLTGDSHYVLFVALTISIAYFTPMRRSVKDAVTSDAPAGQGSSLDGPEVNQSADAVALIRLSALVRDTFARVAQRHELTPVQARLLCALVEGPRGMAELAHDFGVEKAALTGLADRIEQRGLAKRVPVPDDRRAVRMTLTDIGRRKAAAFHAEMTAEITRLLSPLAPDDREQFRAAIAKITQSEQSEAAPSAYQQW